MTKISSRTARRISVVGVAALVGLGGLIVSRRADRPVEVRAEGRGSPSTSSPIALSSSTTADTVAVEPATTSSSTTTVTTRARPIVTTATSPTTTTTVELSCAPAAPHFVFGLLRLPDGNGWAGGGNPALQRSTDGGRTWAPACVQADAVTGPGAIFGITFAADGRHGWATGGSSQQPLALHTHDGGEHWLAATVPAGLTGSLGGVTFPDTIHGWTVGSRMGTGPANAAGGYVLATADGGRTWATQPVPTDVARLNRIVFPDTRHGWAVGVAADGRPALISTGDGGTTWTHQTIPSGIAALRDVAFVDAERGWAVGQLAVEAGQAPPGVVVVTTDGGRTWTQQATTARDLWTVAVVDAGTAFAGGGYGLWSTRDGGATWTEQRFALPALDAISFADANRGWVTHSMFSAVCRTDDGGQTWTAADIRPGKTPAVSCTP